jgi:hypothetical protein
MRLYEILVPVRDNTGTLIPQDTHKLLADRIVTIAGGVTLCEPVFGCWRNPDTGQVQGERMIPLRVACNSHDQWPLVIIECQLAYPDQQELMSYVVGEDVVFTKRFARHV